MRNSTFLGIFVIVFLAATSMGASQELNSDLYASADLKDYIPDFLNWDSDVTEVGCKLSFLEVSNITSSSAVITWVSQESCEGRVRYSLTVDLENEVEGTSGLIHSIRMKGLPSGTRIYYQVYSGEEKSEVKHFQTSAVGAGIPKVVYGALPQSYHGEVRPVESDLIIKLKLYDSGNSSQTLSVKMSPSRMWMLNLGNLKAEDGQVYSYNDEMSAKIRIEGINNDGEPEVLYTYKVKLSDAPDGNLSMKDTYLSNLDGVSSSWVVKERELPTIKSQQISPEREFLQGLLSKGKEDRLQSRKGHGNPHIIPGWRGGSKMGISKPPKPGPVPNRIHLRGTEVLKELVKLRQESPEAASFFPDVARHFPKLRQKLTMDVTSVDLYEGINILALPLDPDTTVSSYGILRDVTGATVVTAWDGELQQFGETAIWIGENIVGVDFPFELGYGYFVTMDTTGQVYFDGDPVTWTNYSPIYPGLEAVTLVGHPDSTTSFSLLNDMFDGDEVCSFDSEIQSYKCAARFGGHIIGDEFNLVEGTGYFVRLTTSGYFPTDNNPPSVTISSPADNTEIHTKQPFIEIIFDDHETGLVLDSLRIVINSVDKISFFTIDNVSAIWQPMGGEELLEGENVIEVSIYDINDQQRYVTSTFDVVTLPPPDDEHFVNGYVYDGETWEPMEGIAVRIESIPGVIYTDSDGHYVFPTPGLGKYEVEFEKEHYTYAQRYMDVEDGHGDVFVDDAYLSLKDSVVTRISVEGGVAGNSDGSVWTSFPHGIIDEDINVRTTNFNDSEDLPAPLPGAAAFTYCADFGPEGTTFSGSAFVDQLNSRGFATGTPIPLGHYNSQTTEWESEGMAYVGADNSILEFGLTHFSPVSTCLSVIPAPCGAPVFKGSVNTAQYGTGDKSPFNGSITTEWFDFAPAVNYGTDDYPHSVYSTDLDNDNDNDLAVANQNSDNISILLNSGNGIFTPAVNYWAGDGPISIYSADLDGDSDNDLAVANAFSNNVSILLNNGNGTFQSAVNYGVGSYPHSVYSTDLDGDTDNDLAVVNYSYDNVSVLLNNGDGTFQSRVNYGAGDAPRSVYCADLDGDSDNDLAVANAGSDNVSILLNNGDGTFQSRVNYGAGNEPLIVCSADLDGDNDNDLAVANINSYNVSILLNNGDGTFQSAINYGAGDGPFSVCSADLDGDSDNDLAVANSSSDNVSILINISRGGPPPYQFSTQCPNSSCFNNGSPSLGNVRLKFGGSSVSHSLPSVKSLGFDRSPSFTYASHAVQTQIVVETSTLGIPDTMPLPQYTGAKIDNAGRRFSGIMETSHDTTHQRIRYDARDIDSMRLSTGLYYCNDILSNYDTCEYALTNSFGGEPTDSTGIWTDFAVGSESRAITELKVDNFLQGALGSGWALNGLQRLYMRPDGDMMINEGGRPIQAFEKKLDGSGYLAEDGDFTKLSLNNDSVSFSRIYPDSSRVVFDTSGYQIASIDRSGNTTTYEYDEYYNLMAVTYPGSLVTQFDYVDGLLETVTDPAGRITEFDHDEDGNLISITDPDSSFWQYEYDDDHLLTKVIDPRDNETIYEYDSLGYVTRVIGADSTANDLMPSDGYNTLNEAIDQGYGVPGNPAPAVKTNEIINTFVNTKGDTTYSLTNEYGRRTKKIDVLGRVHKFDYNEDGYPTELTRPDSTSVSMSWSDYGKITSYTDESTGATTSYKYDPVFHKPTTVVDALGDTTKYELDSLGNTTKSINAVGDTTHYFYDSRGLLTKTVNAAGDSTLSYYGATGSLDSTVNELGHVTKYEYDLAGNQVAVIDPLNYRTESEYDANNRMILTRDPLGNETEYIYDPSIAGGGCCGSSSNNLLLATINPADDTTWYDYDEMGRQISTTDPLGYIAWTEYDSEGRVQKKIDPEGRWISYEYDDAGNMISQSDSLGRTTTYEYDSRNRKITTTDAMSGITRYIYDDVGNLTNLISANGDTTSFTYDLLNRKTSETDPLDRTKYFRYNSLRQMDTLITAKGDIITFEYDALGRLAEKQYPVDTLVQQYDEVGNIMQVDDSDSRLVMTYDDNGQMRTISTGDIANPDNLQPVTTIEYLYNDAGRKIAMIDPVLDTTFYYYDVKGQLDSLVGLNEYLFEFEKDKLGRITQLSRPNGTTTDFTYDASSQMLSIEHRSGIALLDSLVYSYNPVGMVELFTDEADTSTYSYDSLDQVLTADYTDPQLTDESFTYDSVGNRLTSHLSSQYDYDDANQITSDDTYVFTFDDNGNMTGKEDTLTSDRWEYSYDYENRLVTVEKYDGGLPPASMEANYSYDGQGRRICKTVESDTIIYIYDGSNILYEYDASESVIAVYIQGPSVDQPFMVTRGEDEYYFHADKLGSIRLVSDSTGTIVQTYQYDSFGNIVETMLGDTISPYTYTGREWDEESGLYYYRARYYDSNAGRFLQMDPIGVQENIALYTYVGNNPINLNDPTGHIENKNENSYLCDVSSIELSNRYTLSRLGMENYQLGPYKPIHIYQPLPRSEVSSLNYHGRIFISPDEYGEFMHMEGICNDLNSKYSALLSFINSQNNRSGPNIAYGNSNFAMGIGLVAYFIRILYAEPLAGSELRDWVDSPRFKSDMEVLRKCWKMGYY
ncbi:MAG: hypothetical protein GY861_16300 [bacterium]|nr:hypothetical protein [bacterium]